MNTLTLHLSGRISAGVVKDRPRLLPFARLTKQQRENNAHYSAYPEALQWEVEQLAPMGLSRLSNSDKIPKPSARAPRGAKGISTYGANLVKDAATWLEMEYGRECLSFWTGTIPPEQLTKEIIEKWPQIIETLQRKMRRLLKSRSLPTHFLLVTEIQESRFSREGGVPPLHFHALFVGALTQWVWKISKEELAELWQSVLASFAGLRLTVQSESRVESVKKSAAGYLGKYMSKGTKVMRRIPPGLHPSAWYSCTNDLKRAAKACTVKLSGQDARGLYDWLLTQPHLLRWSKHVRMRFGDGNELCVGWYGDLVDRLSWAQLRDMMNALASSRRQGALWKMSVHTKWLNRKVLSDDHDFDRFDDTNVLGAA